jgi:hypothetical protein
MYISCPATDYDGTLAHDGIVDDATADAFVAFRRSGKLADELEQIEGQPARDPRATRRSVREAIERKYTAPASAR